VALAALNRDFSALYAARLARPSIPPEMLLQAMLLRPFYTIRSERQLMERLKFDLLFPWFVGLGVDDPASDHSSFSKNRDRLLAGEIAAKFLAAVLVQPRVERLLSSDRYSVGGTLIEDWASMGGSSPRIKAEIRRRRRPAGATPRSTSRVRSVQARRTRAPPIPKPGSTVRARSWRLSSASSAMPRWRTARP
jgi:transposase